MISPFEAPEQKLQRSEARPKKHCTAIPTVQRCRHGHYLEGHGDVVTRLIMGITGVILWFIGVISILTKSPDPPSKDLEVI